MIFIKKPLFFIKEEIMKRLTKEYCLNINKNIDVKYGSVNRLNPLVIYINCKSWICPTTTECDYSETLNTIFNNLRKEIKKKVILSEYFENKLICDFDINTASIREKKKKYISFEFYLKQKGTVIDLKNLKDIIEEMFKTIIDDLVINLETHTFKVTKGK